jgi:hypothetical protein
MRCRALVVIASLTLASGLGGQGIRLPRIGRRTAPAPAPLPPEAPAVKQALAYKRSRWSAEAYSLVNSIQVPATAGAGATSYTTFGTGTRADYRYTERFSATMDLTVSPIGDVATSETAEIGMRYWPLERNDDLRPFVDVRAAYMHMNDMFAAPMDMPGGIGGLNQQFAEEARFSHGLGSVAGAGFEYSITRSLSLTTELSAMRNRMTTYRLTGPVAIPTGGSTYWMTLFRYTLGFKYNPVRALNMIQKALP